MKSSSLQFKVLLIVAAAMLFMLGVAILSLHRVYASIEELDRVSREDFQSQLLILKAHGTYRHQIQEGKNILLRGKNPADFERHMKSFEAKEKETAQLAQEARAGTPDEGVRASLTDFIEQHKAAGEQFRQGIEKFKELNFDVAAGDAAVEGVDRAPAAVLLKAAAQAEERGTGAVNRAVKSADNVFKIAIGALVAAMLASLVSLWVYVRRAVLDPLRSAARVAERIAEGDLTAEIRASSRDEAGQLLSALERMNAGLGRVVSQVRQAAESVVTASHQVSAGTTDLSQRTEEQASSLEETAASMEELASTVRQNADNAKEANALALGASKRAEQGGHEVVNVVMTMGEISDSARRIADIISVIDGIAFQTNILALNAAVEAARAGEQGRGFAVVASEVRSLAQRSAQAAKEIKDLIGTSVAKVQDGTRLVEQAGDTIQALVIDVKRVSDLMGSIAEASAEQSRGVQQVNKTVTEMDRVVQQNAAAVQQAASAAAGMRSQAEQLVLSVGTFQLTVEERVEGTRIAEAQASHGEAPAQPAVRDNARIAAKAQARSAPAPAPAQAAAAVAATTAGDEWEEF